MDRSEVVVDEAGRVKVGERPLARGGVVGDAVGLNRLRADRDEGPRLQSGREKDVRARRKAEPPVHAAAIRRRVVRAGRDEDGKSGLGQAVDRGLDLVDEPFLGIVRVEEIARDRHHVDRLRIARGEIDGAEEGGQEITRPLGPALPDGREGGPEMKVGQMEDPDAHRRSLESHLLRSRSASTCARNAIGRGRRSRGKKATSLASSPAVSRPPVTRA